MKKNCLCTLHLVATKWRIYKGKLYLIILYGVCSFCSIWSIYHFVFLYQFMARPTKIRWQWSAKDLLYHHCNLQATVRVICSQQIFVNVNGKLFPANFHKTFFFPAKSLSMRRGILFLYHHSLMKTWRTKTFNLKVYFIICCHRTITAGSKQRWGLLSFIYICKNSFIYDLHRNLMTRWENKSWL